METNDFREFGKAMVDYIADYWDNIRNRNVLSSVEPGYLQKMLPKEAPSHAENWQAILTDVEKCIMPGVTHWISPQFHAYYPTGNSGPSVIGDMLSSAIGCIGFNWLASPACTELEVIVLNWLGKLMGLPEEFLQCSNSLGGGVIQGSASESTLVGLLTAKDKITREMMSNNPNLQEHDIKSRLVAYTSDQANSSVEKAGLLASVKMVQLPSDDCKLTAKTLKKAILKDRAAGLIPCYVVATFGTTGTCAFDEVEEIGKICNEENVWLHIDAAYAGAALICPEFRYLMKGIELCDSFSFNPHKWLLVNFDCSALWVKNSKTLIEAFNVERIYLPNQHEKEAPEYRHWQIPLGRRFRALKLWFVMRLYGTVGLQTNVRHHIELAKHFEDNIKNDNRFEVCSSSLGLVCFRLKGDNDLTKRLLTRLIATKEIFMGLFTVKNKLVIRFPVCSRLTNKCDINQSLTLIKIIADDILAPNCSKSNNNAWLSKTQKLSLEKTK